MTSYFTVYTAISHTFFQSVFTSALRFKQGKDDYIPVYGVQRHSMHTNPVSYAAESTAQSGASPHQASPLCQNPSRLPHPGSGVVVHFQLFVGQRYDPEALGCVNLKFTNKTSWYCLENSRRLICNLYSVVLVEKVFTDSILFQNTHL